MIRNRTIDVSCLFVKIISCTLAQGRSRELEASVLGMITHNSL
jgi:hypothetical protein